MSAGGFIAGLWRVGERFEGRLRVELRVRKRVRPSGPDGRGDRLLERCGGLDRVLRRE
jgi:hypothetical protein